MADVERLMVRMEANIDKFEERMNKAIRASYGAANKIEKNFAAMNDNVGRRLGGSGSIGQILTNSLGGARGAVDDLAGRAPLLGSAMNGVTGPAIALAAAAGGVAIALREARQAMQWADDLVAQADKIGITAERFQELSFAAEAVDIPADKARESLENLNATVGALQSGIADKRVKPIAEALGLTPDQLKNIQTGADLLPILADRIKAAGTQAEQVHLAKKLGVEPLLPLLQQGSEGIAQLSDRARDLGVVIEERLLRQAADLNEKLRQNDEVIRSKLTASLLNLAPIVADTSNLMVDMVGVLERLTDWFGRAAAASEDWAARHERAARAAAIASNAYNPVLGLIAVRQAAQARPYISDSGGRPTRLPSADELITGLRDLAAPPPPKPEAVNYGTTKPTRASKPRGKSAEQLERERLQRERRYEDALRQIDDQLTSALAEQAVTAEELAEVARDRLRAERAQYRQTIERQVQDKQLTQAQADTLLEQQKEMDIVRAANITRQERRAIEDRGLRLEGDIGTLTAELLQMRAGQARTMAARWRIEGELLKLAHKEQRDELERRIVREKIKEAEAARLRAVLGALQKGQTTAHGEAPRSPIDVWRQQGPQTAEEMAEAFEEAAVRGLDALNQGIVDAIMNARSLGDVFHQVARQIIADLLQIAIRKQVTEPLANMIFGQGGQGGGGGRGMAAAVATFFKSFGGGRESGGPVRAGRMYLVGEKRPELFVPSSNGMVLPRVPSSLKGGGAMQFTYAPVYQVQGYGQDIEGLKAQMRAHEVGFRSNVVAAVRDGLDRREIGG